MLLDSFNVSIRFKLLVLLIVNMSIFMIIILSSYFFTNTNVKSIETINKYELPASLLHAQNFSLLEKLMDHFIDSAITGEKDTLLQTTDIKSELLKNLDSLALYNTNVYHLKVLVEDYYIQGYAITLNIIQDKGEIKTQRLVSFQNNSKSIFFEFQKYKDESRSTLVKSLKNISDNSKVFFKNSLIIFIIGFVFVLSIGVLTYTNINNRFNTILKSVKNLTVEKPDFSVVLKDTYNDELGELTKLFHKVSIKLENTNHVLEKEVCLAIEKTKKQEQKLIEQSRLAQMGEMISMIAHQWRQPLNIINSIGINIGFMAENKDVHYQKIIQKTEEIEQHVVQMSKTIDDFRNFFKPTNKKVETDFERIVSNVLTLFKASLENKNIEIIVEKHTVGKIYIFDNEVIQVIINLMRNAEDALIEKEILNPFIKISMYMQDKHNILEIKDNAGGIDEKILHKIFDPYFSTKGRKEGTGIGLYMSKLIITDHCDGKLTVDNDEFGAVFKIIF